MRKHRRFIVQPTDCKKGVFNMKNKKIVLWIALMAMAVIFQGCSKKAEAQENSNTAQTKVSTKQEVQNTKWARQVRDDEARLLRAVDIVTFEVYEFGKSNFTYYYIYFGLAKNTRNFIMPGMDLEHDVPVKQREGTYKQSGDTINLTNSDKSNMTLSINTEGNLSSSDGKIVFTKVQSLEVTEFPDSLKK